MWFHQGSTYSEEDWVSFDYTWNNNQVLELIAVKALHTSLLNTTVVAFKILPLGSCATMPASSPPFKTILELVLWNGLQSCSCITHDVINVIKTDTFKICYKRKINTFNFTGILVFFIFRRILGGAEAIAIKLKIYISQNVLNS